MPQEDITLLVHISILSISLYVVNNLLVIVGKRHWLKEMYVSRFTHSTGLHSNSLKHSIISHSHDKIYLSFFFFFLLFKIILWVYPFKYLVDLLQFVSFFGDSIIVDVKFTACLHTASCRILDCFFVTVFYI